MLKELELALMRYNTVEAIRLVTQSDQNTLNKADARGFTALHSAASWGNEKVCELLLSRMSPQAINSGAGNSYTALHLASCKRNNKKICELLLSRMSPQAINSDAGDGYTALHLAVRDSGDEEICKLLLSKMSAGTINIVDKSYGHTILHIVARFGNFGSEKICELLLSKISPQLINALDHAGWTALRIAANRKNEKVFELLLSKMSVEAINMSTLNVEVNNMIQSIKTKQQTEQLAKQKAETEAKKQAELLVKHKAEAEAKQQAELLAKHKAEVEAKQQAELLVKQKAEVGAKQQAKLLAKHKAEEIIMKSKQPIIKEIFNLIVEGDTRIKEETEKGILILGKTGAGKSTLACLLGNQELEAFEDNKGDLRLKNANSYDGNIKIGHTTVSETKIPNKYKLVDTTIWDCPGFMDTRSIAQEIANAFYIQRLFETNKQLKFILAIPEADLQNRTNILPIVEQFTKGFTDIKTLKDSVTLTITKASPNKKPTHIQIAIKELIEQNSNNIEPKTLQMLQFLQKSIQIFRSPTDEGIIPNSDMLKAIDDTTHYVDLTINRDLANIVISRESTEYAKELFEITYATLKKLADTFYSAISQSNKCLNNNPENIFIKSYEVIKSWLPSKVEYFNLNRLPKHEDTEYFINLEQIKAFQKLFNAFANNQNSSAANSTFLKMLEIFEEFTKDTKLKEQIQEYAHIFKQQIEYTKFLSRVCDNKPVDYSYIEQAIQKCKAYVNSALEKEIKSIKLEAGKLDIAYYTKAIEYLDQYKNDLGCIKVKADAYNNIGRIYDNQGNYDQALLNYAKALELDIEFPKIYDRLGEILFNKKQYSKAIQFFKVNDKSIKIENCFKELIKLDSNNPNIKIEKGNYYFSIGRYDKAMGCYRDALSLSEDDNTKMTIKHKMVVLLNQQAEKGKELACSINKEMYHYKEVDASAISKMANDLEVSNIGNAPNLYD